MNLKDLQGAIEDMLQAHGADLDDVVFILQPNGDYKSVNGFDRIEDGRIIVR